MSEIFSDKTISDIIYVNKLISSHRNEPFGYVAERLADIFNQVNSFNDIKGKRERIIKKASYLLGGITYWQPFFNGNKRTALAVTIHFFRRNSFALPLKTKKDEKEMFELLERTMLKFEGDDTIISEIEEYLKRKIVAA
ncbi:MAG: Fic family protein [Rhabdochlamydiaceae bacterium]